MLKHFSFASAELIKVASPLGEAHPVGTTGKLRVLILNDIIFPKADRANVE